MTYAKEAVAYITHEVVTSPEGKIMSVKQVRSHLILPEGSPTSVKEHYDNIAKAETLIDWDTVMSLGKKVGSAAIAVGKAVVKTKGDIDKYGPSPSKRPGGVAKENKN